MRNILTLILLLAFSGVWGQRNQLKAYIDYKSFYSPEHGSYLELHVQYAAISVNFEPVDNELQAQIGVKFLILTEENRDTVLQDSYVLRSPKMRDSIVEDFFDVVKYQVKPGKYVVSVELKDLLAKSKPISGEIQVEVRTHDHQVSFSDVMVAEVATPSENAKNPMYKSGFEIIPRISNFYGQEENFLPYYVELYNTNLIPDSIFGFKLAVVNTLTGEAVDGMSRFTKLKTTDVIPIMRKIDLSNLVSGAYALKLDIVDRENNQLTPSQLYYFDRANDVEDDIDVTKIILDPAFQESITDDSLKFFLASLIPIARPAEARSILETLKTKNSEMYRKHIQQFWLLTAGPNAYSEWLKYKRQVILVQVLYGTKILEGYETDRGRVYLQYGAPNNIITKESSPSEYPYEIWTYYKIKHYSNKRFIFYNPDFITENYRLLHSDMIGEPQNYKWPQMLVKRNTPDTNTEDSDGGAQHYGGESQYYYKQY